MNKAQLFILLFAFASSLLACNHDDITRAEEQQIENTQEGQEKMTSINIIIGNTTLPATLINNSSTVALIEILKKGQLTINMHDYGNMEKVGNIGTTLPRNDEYITAKTGDLILYQGNAMVIYYRPNTYNFTRLGKINNITEDELMKVLGNGDLIVKLELSQPKEKP